MGRKISVRWRHSQSASKRAICAFCDWRAARYGHQMTWEDATMAGLSDILETTQLEKVAGGFVFSEGPLWHPDGFWYFVDIRQNLLYRMVLGQKPEVVRKTIGGNGTTFDLQGRLVNCEGDGRMVTRLEADGSVTTLV